MMRPVVEGVKSCTTCLDWAQEGERLFKINKFTEGIPLMETALEVGTDDLRILSSIYQQLGNAFYMLQEYEKSVEYHNYTIIISRLLEDCSSEADACGNVGHVLKIQGSYDDSLTFTKRQLELSRKLGNGESIARGLYNMSSVYRLKAKFSGRLSQLQKGAAAADVSVGNPSSEASQTFEEDINNAFDYSKQHLEIMQLLSDRSGCGRTYGNIGDAFFLLKDYESAIKYHQMRLEVALELREKAAQRRAYVNLGNAHLLLSELDKAMEYFRLALSLAMEMGDRAAEADVSLNLASTALVNSDFHSAAEYHGRHLSLARALKDRAGEARAYVSLAGDYKRIGDWPKAAYFLTRQRHIAREMNDHLSVRQAEESLREILAAAGDALIDGKQIMLDGSADPDSTSDTTPLLRLSLSLRSLNGLGEDGEEDEDSMDVGLLRHNAFHSDGDLSARPNSQLKAAGCANGPVPEDFFEFLSRVQSKRMDEQRCDVSILGDTTNINGPRQVPPRPPSASSFAGLNDSHGSIASSNRRRSLFGRVSSSIFKGMKPLSTSTPCSVRPQKKSKSFLRTPSFPRFGSQRSISSSRQTGDRSPSQSSITSAASMAAEPQFRVPTLPVVVSQQQENAGDPRRHSMYVDIRKREECIRSKNCPDALMDLVMGAQGRRMDEQRASLLPGLQGGQDILDKLQSGSSELEDTNQADERMIELLVRAQSQRMNDDHEEVCENSAPPPNPASLSVPCPPPRPPAPRGRTIQKPEDDDALQTQVGNSNAEMVYSAGDPVTTEGSS